MMKLTIENRQKLLDLKNELIIKEKDLNDNIHFNYDARPFYYLDYLLDLVMFKEELRNGIYRENRLNGLKARGIYDDKRIYYNLIDIVNEFLED